MVLDIRRHWLAYYGFTAWSRVFTRNRLVRYDGPLSVLRGFTAAEWPTVEAMRREAFVGTASQVGAQLRALAEAVQLDELVVNTWAHDPAVRRESYALLAQAFALPVGS